jgi:hypothetical protein
VDGNPTPYLRWATQFPDEVRAVLQALRASQGLPEGHPHLNANAAVQAAVKAGVLMPVVVNGVTGAQRFYFAPYGGLSSHERTILDKARAIVSCVRYGQGFAAGTRVRHPKRLLETLIEDKKFRKGHPDLNKQYGILVEKLIGHPVKENYGWNFQILDTDENMKALNVAMEMVEIGEAPSARFDYDAQRALVVPYGYTGPVTTRPQMTSTIRLSSETNEDIIKSLAKLARGMGSHD